jgi:predicted house-cleaning noncanonical NTP pyrophosphatase (MazG superfamily)
MTLTFAPKELPQLASAAAGLAKEFGTKGAFLTAIPPAWTPEFILLSTGWVEALASGKGEALSLPAALRDQAIIVRSSIVGESIWDRGTFLSVPFNKAPSDAEIQGAILRIREDALTKRPGVPVGIIVQRFLPTCLKGTLGNLNRLSRSREHWSRFTEIDGYETVPERFNSQRDQAADPRTSLRTPSQIAIERVFGSACRWLIEHFGPVLGRDRMLLEWAMADDRAYLVQCDLDEDNAEGVDPADQPIISKLTTSSRTPTVLHDPSPEEVADWDKLKVLNELSTDYSPLPQKLYLLTCKDAVSALISASDREEMRRDFEDLFGKMAVIRVSRRAGGEKTTNLPCSSGCLDPSKSISWILDQLRVFEEDATNISDFAFVIHKYIGARAGAWALYDPESPYVQVHANWGLPDALQYYPYDAWDVHTITEEMTSYPSYKSHFLWPESDGDWTFKQIRNSLGRRQCLKTPEVLEIARKTNAIGMKLGRRVAVMWFAGVETETGGRFCLPWYRTFEYSEPDLDTAIGTNHVIITVRGPDDLVRANQVALAVAPQRRIALDMQPSEHLVREPSFLGDIIELALRVEASIIYSGSPFAHPYFQLHGKVPVFLRFHRKSFRTRGLIKYNKLVRDGIPEKVRAKHERVVYANLKGAEILQLLSGKLIEEVQELIAAEGQDATEEELADIYEVLRAMMHQAGVDEQRVVEIADAKRARIGGFDEGIFLLETSLPKPGEDTSETRDVNFDELVREEYTRDRVRVPLAVLGRLGISGDRTFRVPGSDKAIRLSASRDGVELSLEQQEEQLEIEFPDDDLSGAD